MQSMMADGLCGVGDGSCGFVYVYSKGVTRSKHKGWCNLWSGGGERLWVTL